MTVGRRHDALARASWGATLLFAGAVVLTACLPPPPPAPPPPAAPTTIAPPPHVEAPSPFTAASPLYQLIPASAPTQTGDGYGDHLAWEVQRYYGHASLNTQTYSPTFYTVGPAQPLVPITVMDCRGRGTVDQGLVSQLSAVPMPSDAVIPPDNDASVIVWQPSTDTLWETWKTTRVDGSWQACWGGRLQHASSSLGTFPSPYGAAASGISEAAGLITLDDLRSGSIDHAVAIGLVHTLRGVHSWPATRGDGWSTYPGAIPEGQRLRLDPSVDVDALPLTPLGKMIALAMQRYGVIVRDTSGSVTVYAENPLRLMTAGQPDPYLAYFSNKPKYNQLDGIPWNRLQALPLDYGKP